DSSIEVISVGCPLFVPLAEEGLQAHKATKLLAEDYLKEIIAAEADTLILGCTHYPLLYETIAGTVGSGVTLVDSAGPTTEELTKLLKENDLLSENSNPIYEFFVTDAPERVYSVAGRFFGEALNGNLKQITLPTL
ncbi:MAG: glutamate racemase, partial [Candidatus Daviesbacteria bacterium]|nr:glutamate racemase [Candidatus Daviesbacteria bacterium]